MMIVVQNFGLVIVEDEDPELGLRIWEKLGAVAGDPEGAVFVGIDILFFEFVGAVGKTYHSIIARSLRINIGFPNLTPYNYYEWQNVLLVAGVKLLHIVANYVFGLEIIVFEKRNDRYLFFLRKVVLMVRLVHVVGRCMLGYLVGILKVEFSHLRLAHLHFLLFGGLRSLVSGWAGDHLLCAFYSFRFS